MSANKVFLFTVLFLFLTGCSTTEKQATEASQESWPKPFFASSGGSSFVEYKEEFCTTFHSSDIFVYGTILSMEWTQEPFLYVGSGNYEKVPDDSGLNINSCVGISPSVKIKMNVKYNVSNYGFDRLNQDIDIYMSAGMVLGLFPSPIPNYSRSEGERMATLKSKNIEWESGEDISQLILTEGHDLGLFLNYNKEHDMFYIGPALLFWIENLPTVRVDIHDVNFNPLMYIYQKIFNIKTIETLHQQAQKCMGQDLNEISQLYRTDRALESYFYRQSLPTCVIP